MGPVVPPGSAEERVAVVAKPVTGTTSPTASALPVSQGTVASGVTRQDSSSFAAGIFVSRIAASSGSRLATAQEQGEHVGAPGASSGQAVHGVRDVWRRILAQQPRYRPADLYFETILHAVGRLGLPVHRNKDRTLHQQRSLAEAPVLAAGFELQQQAEIASAASSCTPASIDRFRRVYEKAVLLANLFPEEAHTETDHESWGPATVVTSSACRYRASIRHTPWHNIPVASTLIPVLKKVFRALDPQFVQKFFQYYMRRSLFRHPLKVLRRPYRYGRGENVWRELRAVAPADAARTARAPGGDAPAAARADATSPTALIRRPVTASERISAAAAPEAKAAAADRWRTLAPPPPAAVDMESVSASSEESDEEPAMREDGGLRYPELDAHDERWLRYMGSTCRKSTKTRPLLDLDDFLEKFSAARVRSLRHVMPRVVLPSGSRGHESCGAEGEEPARKARKRDAAADARETGAVSSGARGLDVVEQSGGGEEQEGTCSSASADPPLAACQPEIQRPMLPFSLPSAWAEEAARSWSHPVLEFEIEWKGKIRLSFLIGPLPDAEVKQGTLRKYSELGA